MRKRDFVVEWNPVWMSRRFGSDMSVTFCSRAVMFHFGLQEFEAFTGAGSYGPFDLPGNHRTARNSNPWHKPGRIIQ